jgi:hypothetical protein
MIDIIRMRAFPFSSSLLLFFLYVPLVEMSPELMSEGAALHPQRE